MALRRSQCQCLRRISASLCKLKYQHDGTHGLSRASGTRAHCTTSAPLDAPSPRTPPQGVIVVVVVVLVEVVGEGRSSLCHKCIPSTGDANCSLRASCESLCESDSDISRSRGLGPRERSVPRSKKKKRNTVESCTSACNREMILAFSRDKEQRHGPVFRLFRHDVTLREAEVSQTIRS